jgi:hypothetical protein
VAAVGGLLFPFSLALILLLIGTFAKRGGGAVAAP